MRNIIRGSLVGLVLAACGGNAFTAGSGEATDAGDAATDAIVNDAPNDSLSTDAHEASADVDALSEAAACSMSIPPAPTAMYASDPAAMQTVASNGYVLHKNLSGFPNYGEDGAADVLYTSQSERWVFTIPSGNVVSASVVVSVVADDSNAVGPYSFRLWASDCQYDSTTPLPHGSPPGSGSHRFNNWVQLSFPADVVSASNYVVGMLNTSSSSSTNWIAIQWIELRVATM